ncbi:hypothetical protein GCM10010497_16010 [Streptomyces cinereoruber]|uniref:DUF1360 domain-containing protein n=1 Tax=Streptomyces cinereoruber TaxID=67260 RepID=A0AAV4KG31_9ACTN|nr:MULTISPECIES: DUF1360 domain-containing protein [Streptomyces]MBB4157942.1 hypothetical protein [Streptomyces cinereoruber]MBY8816149.1 DUF1360 domain-containing protein [Streptomyces cinereoruber]NIH61905.1 hypothetical protein [Streptomyces cinereoruber]PVC77551.1 hypothetical protein DBP18_04080 [Streptomyces sp. CS081A]QEV35782.1 DUF1360 domain-containing protein [Streptomyces cinereoruber]
MHQFKEAVRSLGRAYSPQEDRRLGGHLGAVVAFGAYTAAWGAAVRRHGTGLPDRHDPWDLPLTAAAVFRLSRLLAKGSVTSPLRAPFTRYESATAPAEVSESPRGGAVRSTVGELITCPFCLSVWLTATFTGARLLWPRATRTVTGGLTALALADALQLGYDCLLQKNTE